MIEQLIAERIDAVVVHMATADEGRKEYFLGMLSALLWVQSGGKVLLPDASKAASVAWERARQPGR